MNISDNITMEANCTFAENAYFAAHPQIDNRDRRVVFQAGFKRAWGQPNLNTLRDTEIAKFRYALELYVKAGFGNSTDFHKQGIAYDAAVEALT